MRHFNTNASFRPSHVGSAHKMQRRPGEPPVGLTQSRRLIRVVVIVSLNPRGCHVLFLAGA